MPEGHRSTAPFRTWTSGRREHSTGRHRNRRPDEALRAYRFEAFADSGYIAQGGNRGHPMVKLTIRLSQLLVVLAFLGCSSNDGKEPSLKEGAREVGQAVGSAAREVGQGAKKAGKAVGEAAKEGGRAFKDAVKGE